MISNYRDAILSIVDKLKGLTSSTDVTFNTVAIWNDQINRMIDGSGYSFLSPAAFIETKLTDTHNLSWGYTSNDINIRIHILDEELDAMDGTLDQNINVFLLRDSVKKLSGFRPTQTGCMQYVGEKQDFEHTNCYHYMIDFKARFVDTMGNSFPYTTTGTFSFAGLTSSSYQKKFVQTGQLPELTYTGEIGSVYTFYSPNISLSLSGDVRQDSVVKLTYLVEGYPARGVVMEGIGLGQTFVWINLQGLPGMWPLKVIVE